MLNPSPSPLSVPSAIAAARSANEPMGPGDNTRPEASWESTVRLQADRTYALAVDDEDDARTACCQILGYKTARREVWFVTVNAEPAEVIAGLQGWEGPEVLRLYRYDVPTRKPFRTLERLPELIAHRLRPGRRGVVVVTVPAAVVAEAGEAAIERWLDRGNAALRGSGSSLLLVFHGRAAGTVEKRLRPLNQALSGLARLQRENGFAYYLIRHWRSDEGVTAALRLALAENPAQRFQMVRHGSSVRRHESLDADMYLAMAIAVEGVSPASGSLERYTDVQTLYQRAMRARAATVIFALDDPAKLHALAHLAHRLRIERGDAMTLVVREMTPCLRHRDECILHACGVNVVLPHGVPSSRFLPMLQSLRGNWTPRPVVDDPGAFFGLEQLPRATGRHDVTAFAQGVRMLLDLASPTPHKGVLLVQRPVRGVSAEQAFAQYQLRRQGDLATVGDDHVALFLYGMHPDQLPAALQHMCRLPATTLFAESLIYATDTDIRTRLFLMLTVAGATTALPVKRALPSPRTNAAGEPGVAIKRNSLA